MSTCSTSPSEPSPVFFAHERLDAYKLAVEFVRWAQTLVLRLSSGVAARGQLDRARTSIVLNIAEGNGKSSAADKCRFFDVSHGSALECAACLDVLHACDLVSEDELETGKKSLSRLVGLLIGLIKSKLPKRVYEDDAEYSVE